MASNDTRMFLCTANVGTVFENLDKMMEPYVDAIFDKIDDLKPEFVSIHMQEVGGKHYKQTMQSVDTFFKYFLSHDKIKDYDRYLVTIDSDFTDDMTFTSLCNIYLIHRSIHEDEIEIYNFREKNFYKFLTRQIYTGNISDNDFIYKERFEKNLFPEFNWSRKGFLQTKWRIRNTIINLVNVHLFHDASNLVALSVSPSIYSENRKKALKYTVEKVSQNQIIDSEFKDYTALFGDFNFRLDLGPLIEKYTLKCNSLAIKGEDCKSKIFKDLNEKEVFIIADKKFIWKTRSDISNESKNMREFDKELFESELRLHEHTRNFPPSYPFMEDMINVNKYMETRCPAWCDRIIYNDDLNTLLSNQENISYDMIGKEVGMGDHKPIYLSFILKSEQLKIEESEEFKNKTLQRVTDKWNYATLKYVYINNNLVDFSSSVVDIHDSAWFTNFYLLNCMKEFPTYPMYTILNLTNKSSSHTPFIFSGQTTDIYEQNDINLNYWFKTISELIIYFHKLTAISKTEENNSHNVDDNERQNNNHCVNICYKMNQIDKNIVNKTPHCVCVSNLCVNLSRSYFMDFFMNSLNANQFKLKHLISYLNDQILNLSKELEQQNVKTSSGINCNIGSAGTSSSNQLNFSVQDLKTSLEISYKSLNILNEIYTFLNSTCVFNLFTNNLKKANLEKRLSVYFNFYTNRNLEKSGNFKMKNTKTRHFCGENN